MGKAASRGGFFLRGFSWSCGFFSKIVYFCGQMIDQPVARCKTSLFYYRTYLDGTRGEITSVLRHHANGNCNLMNVVPVV